MVLKGSTTRVGTLILILVLFTSKMQVRKFWYIGLLLLCESPLFGTILDNGLKTE